MTIITQRNFPGWDGLALVGDVAGPPGAPTVILLHGGGQTRHSWTRTMKALADRGYCVINYDARGHGDSEWSLSGAYGIEALAADLQNIGAAVRGPVACVGASMGGIAAFYAIGSGALPQARALVMVDIVPRPASGGVDKISAFMRANGKGFADLEEAAAAVAAYNPDRHRPSDPSGLMKNLRRRDDGRLYWHWDPRMMDIEPSSEPPGQLAHIEVIASGVSVPTLVVRGEHSDIVDDEGIADMKRLVPHAEVFLVLGAGHMVAGDRNDIFSAGVMAFLDRHFPLSRIG